MQTTKPDYSLNQIHPQKQKNINRLLIKIENSKYTAKTKKTLLEYHEKNGMKTIASQEQNLAITFRLIQEINKNIEQITQADLTNWWNNRKKDYRAGKIKLETLRKKCVIAKKFFRVINGLPVGHYPEIVKGIEWDRDAREQNYIAPSEWLTQEQVKQLIDFAYNKNTKWDIRNACIIALLNDCGMRIGELLSMDLKHVVEENTYLVITLPFSKTNPRTVISYLAKPFVKKWLNLHTPLKNGKIDYDAPLFIDAYGNRLSYSSVAKFLVRLINQTNLKLPRYKKAHVFRHLFSSRARWSADLKDEQMGWSDKSNISQRYTHLTYKDLVKPYFQMINEECEGNGNPMLPKECVCGFINPNIEFCEKCGKSLKALNVLNRNPATEQKIFEAMIEEKEFDEFIGIVKKIYSNKKRTKKD